MPGLKLDIAQQHSFTSIEEEALSNLLRTSDCLHRAFERKIRPWGVTSAQYNALRILRGAQPHGLTCTAIANRMIAADPDITRFPARLKGLKLIRQRSDRRVIWTHISAAGLTLLRNLDPEIHQLPTKLLGHMSAAELAELVRLLELPASTTKMYRIRNAVARTKHPS